jgi:hypothetical protein
MDYRSFRKVDGFHDGETVAVQIALGDSAYRWVNQHGPGDWVTHDPEREPVLTIAAAEQRVAAGLWEEM